MNVIDLEHGLVGCFGIVGGSIAAATGAALSAKRSGNVAVAFFGDGATNQGYFHECLNFAKVLALPAIFVCENKFYGEYTPMEDAVAESRTRPPDMDDLFRVLGAARASGFLVNREYQRGRISVAAPLVSPNSHHVVGGISVATVEEQMPAARIEDAGAAVRDAAAQISDRLRV